MEPQSIQHFFNAIFNDPNSLKNAYQLILQQINHDVAQLENSQPLQSTFIYKTIQLISNQPDTQSPQSHQLYFHIITIFHPPLIASFSSLPQSIQDHLRSGLLNSVLAHQTSRKCMSALGLFLRELIEIDGNNGAFNEWLQPLGQLLKWLDSEDPTIIQAGVQFFIYLFKQTPYNEANSELPLHKVAAEILAVLFRLFTGTAEEAAPLREKILYLVLQTIKTFSIFDGNEDSVVSQCFDGTFELWMSLFSSIIKSSISAHLGLKKYVLKILVIIYRDMNTYSNKKLKEQNAGRELVLFWEFVYRFLPIYIETQVWHKIPKPTTSNYYYDEDSDATLSNSEALAHNIVQFISVLVCAPTLSLLVRLSIYHITNILFHYYMIPRGEAQNWDCNMHYFINPPDHEGIRNKILNVLNQLIEKYNDQAIQGILVISEKFLMNHPQSHTVKVIKTIYQSMDIKSIIETKKLQIPITLEQLINLTQLSGYQPEETITTDGEAWRKSEVALSILGRFSEDIIVFQSKQTGVFDIQSFVRGLMKQFMLQDNSKSMSLLRGQSIYCLTRFTEIISIKYKQLFTDLIVSCSICVSEAFPTAVRVAGCKILSIYFRKLDKHKLKLSEPQIQAILSNQTAENIMNLEITHQTNNFALEALIQIVRHVGFGPGSLPTQFAPTYLLSIFHFNITHPTTLKLCFNLLEFICEDRESYERIIFACDSKSCPLILRFVNECLQAYVNVISSEQKQYLKSVDTDLIVMVLRLANMISENYPDQKPQLGRQIVQVLPLLTSIIQNNDDIQVHVSSTICLKNMVRKSSYLIKEASLQGKVIEAIHSLLKIPSDKTFQAASVYVGNLTILAFDKLLEKPDQSILQEVVLKVFRSRTPSVIQSLVLIYARLINMRTDGRNPFEHGEWMQKLNNIIDFLSSFSIENRMGLKILTDKWLLQQSLFRGKFTKISTFMALSKLFLVRDKRVDNLLVIGFNPSHTNINNDVNAPLKILATLIRCLNNEIGSKGEEADDSQEEDYTLKEEPESNTLEVDLEKFREKDEKKEDEPTATGGLADRQNQQGSTCYMSAMLQFYDDGEECDETTEEDLIHLKDCSTQFELSEYLTDFFLHLNDGNNPHHGYFKDCLKHLLKEDLRNLQKHIKIAL